MEAPDWVMLILRAGTGSVILAHGVNHARGRRRTTDWFASIGFKRPAMQWLASTASEISIGVLLILGLLTSPAAAGLVAVMLVAFWSVHRHNGFFIFRPGEGWEYVATLAMVGAALAIGGAGSMSIDHVLGIEMTGVTGAGLVVAAVVAAAAQLTIFYRPAPSVEPSSTNKPA
ncbi:MAG: DoxX family protein [Acidimicrobiia bacterium]|nr:DoxX family protein [Acidimicrobiia bacterium]